MKVSAGSRACGRGLRLESGDRDGKRGNGVQDFPLLAGCWGALLAGPVGEAKELVSVYERFFLNRRKRSQVARPIRKLKGASLGV